jgi:hypothetical protein
MPLNAHCWGVFDFVSKIEFFPLTIFGNSTVRTWYSTRANLKRVDNTQIRKPAVKPSVDGKITRTLQDWINPVHVLQPVTTFQPRNTPPTHSEH